MQIVKSSFWKKNLAVVWLQVVTVILLLTVLLLLRFASTDLFSFLSEQHTRYFEDETEISEVTSPAKTDEEVVIPASAPVEPLPVVSETEAVPMVKNEVKNAFITPVNGKITSTFGYRNDPFTSEYRKHNGTDIAVAFGTEIRAVADGTVSFVGFDAAGYGNYLTIAHSDHVKTLYGHCSAVLVGQGEAIKAGQVIALVGSTGKSTGNHLHFEIRLDGVPVNAQWVMNLGE